MITIPFATRPPADSPEMQVIAANSGSLWLCGPQGEVWRLFWAGPAPFRRLAAGRRELILPRLVGPRRAMAHLFYMTAGPAGHYPTLWLQANWLPLATQLIGVSLQHLDVVVHGDTTSLWEQARFLVSQSQVVPVSELPQPAEQEARP